MHDGARGRRFAYWIGRFWMWITGWQVRGTLPESGKFILIAAPHTSNWDLPFMLAAAYVLGVRVSWLGKHTLFRGPMGAILRRLGGIPVDRRAPQGLVAQISALFRREERLVIAISPAGTRGKRESWRSGFYRIALAAQVPIACGYLDYGRKEAGIGLSFLPTGNVAADMARIRAFYSGIMGKFPENTATIRLREEEESEAQQEARTTGKPAEG
ncbi:MAG: acyltransferase [Deltaproteobacteria bacterium]|nr:MAG: acyltransferase [Deltaproteobacteria bacterium]